MMNESDVVNVIKGISHLLVSHKCTLGDAMFLLPKLTIELIQQHVSEEYRQRAYKECADYFLRELETSNNEQK